MPLEKKMSLFDDSESESEAVNVYDFYRSHGLSELVSTQLVFHLLLTRTYGFEADLRDCALELNISLPIIFPDNGKTH
jgi:hypothetical protein